MEHKKIIIDQDAYIRYINKDNYEIHIRTQGPNGAWVYKFEKGKIEALGCYDLIKVCDANKIRYSNNYWA